ncbi:MAG: DegT/DnrJ/EryC1/StrS family aminotransferase [Candidatus Roizmanbacteria bacterium]
MSQSIPQVKIQISEEEIQSVVEVMRTGHITQGSKVKLLEEHMSVLTRVPYAVATTNGTSALHTALHAIGIKKGDEVITSPLTFIATANAILMCGAIPIFADIDPQTYILDPQSVERVITKKTKAILVVNLYGQMAQYDELKNIANAHKLFIVEDSAQSINAEYKKEPSGSIGDIASFSFYATKNIMCGEGGMVTTKNEDFFIRAQQFRQHGQPQGTRYVYNGLGYNYRMTDIQAVIALEQLKHVDEITERRKSIAHTYSKGLAGIIGLELPKEYENISHVFHQYTIKVTEDFSKSRDELKEYLQSKSISTAIYYPQPLYEVAHLSQYKKIECSATEKVVNQVLSLPMYPSLTDSEIEYIIHSIRDIS